MPAANTLPEMPFTTIFYQVRKYQTCSYQVACVPGYVNLTLCENMADSVFCSRLKEGSNRRGQLSHQQHIYSMIPSLVDAFCVYETVLLLVAIY